MTVTGEDRGVQPGLDEHAPAGFAAVMATGIVSIAAHLLDVAVVAVALFAINVAAYVALWLLLGMRIARQPRALAGELADHRHGAGFLAIVAGTSTLGAQTFVIAADLTVATALLVLGAALWVVLLYAFFAGLMVRSEKPALADGIDGGWLLAVVATESIAVLIALLAVHWHAPLRRDAGFVAVSLWLAGGMLYVWLVTLIVHRLAFVRLTPAELAPTYWINMGAMATTALAGAMLVELAPDTPFVESLRPFLEGGTVLAWAIGTWWIPLLAILFAWRHLIHRVPLRYHPLYWGAVFPLGMYAVATLEMERAMALGFLDVIPHVAFWIALAAWLATFGGLVRTALLAPRAAGRR